MIQVEVPTYAPKATSGNECNGEIAMSIPTVLVVDDDEMDLLLARVFLDKAGIATEVADNAATALAVCAQRAFDAVVLDGCLGGIDGCDLCRTLRAHPALKDTPILMLTGNEDPSYERRAFDAGVDDFLVKTGNWDLVVSRVRRLLAGSPCNSERRQARSPREPNLQ